MNFKKSQQWLERAKKVMPYPWNQTFSKGPEHYVQGVSPVFASHGSGPYLFDVDGNRYIDYVMGLLPVILGYKKFVGTNCLAGRDYHTIDSSMKPIYSLPHPLEVELSELLCEIIPCAEMVRLGKNGSDVTTAAVRLARAVTGRDKVLCCGYHGWHDWYVGTTWRNKGVPEDVKNLSFQFQYNDTTGFMKLLSQHLADLACIIMEPVNFLPPKESLTERNFIEEIRFMCEKHGTILIFDEMITGFRWSLGGAQQYFGVTPDLACFGKAMGNGWPISAVVGKRELMQEFENIHYSFTFGGEVLSIAAALATIKFIRDNDVIDHLWQQGHSLKLALESLLQQHQIGPHIAKVEGFDCWPRLTVPDPLVKSLISQELISRNILWQESFNISYAHKSRHIERTLAAFDEIFGMLDVIIKDSHSREMLLTNLKGKPIKPRFKVR